MTQMETMRKERTDCGRGSEGALDLHECSPLYYPVVPWDLPDQVDELTGKALHLEKVWEGASEGFAEAPREKVGPVGQGRRTAMQAGGEGVREG